MQPVVGRWRHLALAGLTGYPALLFPISSAGTRARPVVTPGGFTYRLYFRNGDKRKGDAGVEINRPKICENWLAAQKTPSACLANRHGPTTTGRDSPKKGVAGCPPFGWNVRFS